MGATYRYPLTHPASTLVRRPDRWRKQVSAPEPLVGPRTQPWTARWAPRGPRRGVPDMPAVRLAAGFRQGAAAGHPPGHPPPPTSSACGHPAVAGRPPDMADLSTVRTSQFKVTAQPIGTEPVRTATAKRRTPPPPSVRPCAWPAGHGQPRCPPILALTGQDDNAHARLRPTPPLPAPGPIRRDHLHPCSMPEGPQAWSPSNVHAVVSGRPQWTPRSDSLLDTACPVVSGRTPSTPPGTPWRTRSDPDRGTDERHGRQSDILDRHDHEGSPPGHAEPLRCGRRLRLGKPRSARRWQHCQRDPNHGSDQAAAWSRS